MIGKKTKSGMNAKRVYNSRGLWKGVGFIRKYQVDSGGKSKQVVRVVSE
jgi:hypothetical protein